MVATLEEKYQLSTVKLLTFTSKQSPAQQIVPTYAVVKDENLLICPLQNNRIWVLEGNVLRHRVLQNQQG